MLASEVSSMFASEVSSMLASEVSNMLASKVSNMLASEVFSTPKLNVDDYAEQFQQFVSGLLDKLAPLKRMIKCCGPW